MYTPDYIDDPILGRLVRHHSSNRWEGQMRIGRRPVSLFVANRFAGEVTAAVQRLSNLVREWRQWRPRIQKALIAELVPLYNDHWREPRKRRIDAAKLRRELTLHALISFTDGWREVWFEQKTLFTDHDVLIEISPENEILVGLGG